MKFWSILCLLLLAGLVSATITVSPMNWTALSENPATLTKTFTISNSNVNDSISVSLVVSAAVSSYVSLSSYNIVVPNSSTGTVVAVANFGNMTGNLTGFIQLISSEGSPVIQVLLSKDKWVFSTTRWTKFTEDILVTPHDYKVRYTSVSNRVEFDVYQGSSKVGSERLELGDSTDNRYAHLRLTVVDVDTVSKEVKMKIDTDDPDSVVSFEPNTGSSSGTGRLISSIGTGKKIGLNKGETKTVQFTVRNGFSVPIEIRSVDFDTYFADVFSVMSADLVTLQPNNELSISVLIDASKAKSGDYTADLKIIGYLEGGEQQTLTVQFSVKVIGTAGDSPESGTFNPSVLFSSTAIPLNTPISITIQNVAETDNVMIATTPVTGASSGGAAEFVGTTRVERIQFTKAGKYGVTVSIYRTGIALPFVKEQTVIAGRTGVALHVALLNPPLAQNKEAQLAVTDDDNATVDDAAITINGAAISGYNFNPSVNTTDFTICAALEPYAPTSPCPTFSIIQKLMTVSVETKEGSQFPVEGDLVTFTARDSETGAVLPVSVSKDGIAITNPSSFAAGNANLSFAYADYAPVQMVLTISSFASQISIDGEQNVGKEITITLDKVSSYSVFLKNGANEEFVEGKGAVSSGVFIPQKEGSYVVRSGNAKAEFTVYGNGWLDGKWLGIPKWNFFLILLIVVIMLAGWLLWGKKASGDRLKGSLARGDNSGGVHGYNRMGQQQRIRG